MTPAAFKEKLGLTWLPGDVEQMLTVDWPGVSGTQGELQDCLAAAEARLLFLSERSEGALGGRGYEPDPDWDGAPQRREVESTPSYTELLHQIGLATDASQLHRIRSIVTSSSSALLPMQREALEAAPRELQHGTDSGAQDHARVGADVLAGNLPGQSRVISVTRNINEQDHGDFTMPLAALLDMVAQGDYLRVISLARQIEKTAQDKMVSTPDTDAPERIAKRINDILVRVATYYKVSVEEIVTKRRYEPLATIRGVTMLLLSAEGIPTHTISCKLHLTARSGVSHCVRAIRKREATDKILANDLRLLRMGEPGNGTTFATQRYLVSVERRKRSRQEHRAEPLHPKSQTLNRRDVQRVREHDYQGTRVVSLFAREGDTPGWGSVSELERRLAAL